MNRDEMAWEVVKILLEAEARHGGKVDMDPILDASFKIANTFLRLANDK